MELILALILGAILFGRIRSDKAATKSAAIDFEESEAAFQEQLKAWLAKVADVDLERELETYICEPRNRKAVIDAVNKAYREMGHDQDADAMIFLAQKTKDEAYASRCRKTALRIMMARRGKLLYWDAHDGIDVTIGDAPTYNMRKAKYQQKVRLVFWINDQLKKHGINEPLGWHDYAKDECYYPIGEMRAASIYLWRPAMRQEMQRFPGSTTLSEPWAK